MASRIALIRHGQTTWSASGQHTSVTDLDLTDHGVVQARTIPALLSGLSLAPTTVWSSPRLRARRTAELAGLVIDEVVEDLAEWNYGEYEGITSKQIHVNRPGWSIFTDGAPGGESPEQVSARADKVLTAGREALELGDVALVCHGHMSRVLAVRWVGLPITAGGLILMDPAAITVLGNYHDKPCIAHANVVPFQHAGTMSDPRIRPAGPGDVGKIVELVYELAEYEKLVQECHLTDELLAAALFGDSPAVFGHVAEVDAELVGYTLHFLNYSTWEGVHGIYLEDLYVRPEHRGSGLGKALLINLAEIAVRSGHARVEWSVLDWNAPSIAFYRGLGAVGMDGWTVFRLSGPALARTGTGNG